MARDWSIPASMDDARALPSESAGNDKRECKNGKNDLSAEGMSIV